jgi:hypothetical protein
MFANNSLFRTISQESRKIERKGIFTITPVRVKYTFLNLEQTKIEYPEIYTKYGEDFSLNGILFDSISQPTATTRAQNLDNYIFAKPLFPNFRQVPLINEIAYVITLPSVNLQDPNFINLNDQEFYYFLPINIWNSVHNNALPNPTDTTTATPSEIKSYQEVEAGSRVKVTDGVDDINLGETFDEQPNIKNLQPFEGDVIFEGRWGQSFRFGSTVTGSNGLPYLGNQWSTPGDSNQGDPIIIIRNGQYDDGKEAWKPILEDINKDPASIYMGSTQTIPLNNSSSYNSYYVPPTNPKEYSGNQIIVNSGRVVINAYNDHLLLISNNSVNLNAVESVNIDTKETIIQSNVYLGGKDATEPLLKGKITAGILQDAMTNIATLADTLQLLISQPAGTNFATLAATAGTVSKNLGVLITKLQNESLSTKSFTE